jgi:hypothetical protein
MEKIIFLILLSINYLIGIDKNKENYKIIYTSSSKYTSDTTKWLTVYIPNKDVLKECKTTKDIKTKDIKTKNIKNISTKSNSSIDKSIADDSETETETDEEKDEEIQEKPKDKYACGKCLLTIKKSF